MADEALGAMATESEVVVPRTSISTEFDLELTGLTTGAIIYKALLTMTGLPLETGVLVLLAAIWSLLSHHVSSRSRYLNESGTACLLGLAAGWVLLAYRDRSNAGLVDGLLRFNSAAFFTYLLPPVIFYAGLSVEQRLFFSNLPSILSFGVLGTLVSFLLISAALYSLAGTTIGMGAQDCLALGAVFAATDSVAVLGLLDPRSYPQLFSLVFGEGIVNDATSVVLLGALARMARQSAAHANGGADSGGKFSEEGTDPWVSEGDSGFALAWRLLGNFGYLLLTSTCLGLAAGLGVAALLRGRVASQGPHHEVALVGLLSYLAYLAAEVLGLSAILSLFCCGVAVSHFALQNGMANSSGTPTPAGGGSADVSTHNANRAGAGSDPGAREDVSTHGDGRVVAPAPAGALTEHNGCTRVWYGSAGGGDDDDRAPHDGAARDTASGAGGGAGSRVLQALTAPASRLAVRAFGDGSGKSCMSAVGASTTINAFRSLSYVAEGLIFVYLGMDCLDPVRWEASYTGEVLWLVGLLLFLLLAARAASVIPLSMLHNLYAPAHQKLSGRDMLIIWWSGLMRGAVSVALVYLNFDTADGSKPAAQPIITPRHGGRAAGPGWGHAGAGHDMNSSASARGLLHAHMRMRLLQASADGGMAATAEAMGSAADAVASGTANPDAAAALALAAALAEADDLSARQHATLIVSTLLVVVASVLVVSTLTKPLLQAALEADPRKPPLKVLTEALFDPWVEATWRLQVALDRSYRRWTSTVVGPANANGNAEDGRGGGAGASTDSVCGLPAVSRRAATPSTPLAMITTHTIPMTSLGVNGAIATIPAAPATAVPGAPPGLLGSKAVAERQVHEPPTSLAGSLSLNPEEFSALSRPRGGQLQQRSHAVAAAAAGGGPAGPSASGAVPCPPSPSPGAASLIAMLPYRTGQGREAAATTGASTSPGSSGPGHGTSTAERPSRLRVAGTRKAGAAVDERHDEADEPGSESGIPGSGVGAAAAGTRAGTPN